MPEIGFDPVAAFQVQTLLETRRQQLQLHDQLRSDEVRQNDVREQQLIEDRRRDDVRTEALRQQQVEEDRRAPRTFGFRISMSGCCASICWTATCRED